MPNIGTLILWGLPLLTIVVAFLNFLAWLLPLATKTRLILRGILMTAGFLLITYMDRLVAVWPGLAEYGPGTLWAVAVFLISTGFLKLEELMGKTVAVLYKIKNG